MGREANNVRDGLKEMSWDHYKTAKFWTDPDMKSMRDILASPWDEAPPPTPVWRAYQTAHPQTPKK
jgi:hypothetical protein